MIDSSQNPQINQNLAPAKGDDLPLGTEAGSYLQGTQPALPITTGDTGGGANTTATGAANYLSGSSSSLTFRSEASWPLRFKIHQVFEDGFPKLQEKLTSNEPNEHGNYIYHFGFCDFDSQDDADRASQCLKDLCDSLSTAVQKDDKNSMNELRQGLEAHLSYWKKNPAITGQQPVRPAPLGSGGMPMNNQISTMSWDAAVDETSRTASLTAAAAAAAAANGTQSSATAHQKATNGSVKTGRWTEAEHQLFLDLMKEHGRSWTQIAAKMPTRSEPQVRSHAQKYFLKQDGGKLSSGNKKKGSHDDDDDFEKPKRQKRQDAKNPIVHTTPQIYDPTAFMQFVPNQQQLVQNVRVFDQFGLNASAAAGVVPGALNAATFLSASSNPQAALMAVAGLATEALPPSIPTTAAPTSVPPPPPPPPSLATSLSPSPAV